ncbi:MAG: hypothetical protein ACRYFU_26040 [Janthinobacterium lividum]
MPDLDLWQCFLIELGVLAIALLCTRWKTWQRWMSALEPRLQSLAQRPQLCFWAIFTIAVVWRLVLLPLQPVPRPLFHDEFSYLLGADTFMHARLTNPTPPVPLALETIHANMWPTYQSMYMPGPALLLALGQRLGSPWIAVLLATALFPAVLYWAFSAWVPRSFALVASGIALGITGSMNWWFDNYFCLALSCLGTTLVLGSLPRISRSPVQQPGWTATWPLSLGLIFLLLTRPYEGFCIVFPCILVLVWYLRRMGWPRVLNMAAFPSATLSLTVCWLLYCNWRGTGHALLFPYMLNFRLYHITGPFLFSAKHPIPSYNNGMLRRFYPFAELPQFDFMRAHPLLFLAKKISIYYASVLLGFGLLAVTGLVYLARHASQRLFMAPLLAFAGFAFNVLLMAWAPFPQYAAPAAPLLYLLAIFGIFWLAQGQSPFPGGRKLVHGLVLAELMLGLSCFGYRISAGRDFPEPQYVSKDRARVADEVSGHPGKQLCLVRYTATHDGWQEWIFNGADPENARLVWARSLNPKTDQQVIAAYPGRQVWLVTPDVANSLLQPYSPTTPFPPRDREPPSPD